MGIWAYGHMGLGIPFRLVSGCEFRVTGARAWLWGLFFGLMGIRVWGIPFGYWHVARGARGFLWGLFFENMDLHGFGHGNSRRV